MRHVPGTAVRTQLIIFNLFGDYVSPRQVAVPTAGLLQVLGALDVSERAARSTFSRMKRKGWLSSRRKGRQSQYFLTPSGKALLDEGTQRLFGPRPDHWDGRWHIVAYSLPQQMRKSRHQLRTRLSWLGFGMLHPGTMVAAHVRRQEVLALIRELRLESYAHFFTEAGLDTPSPEEIVARCWDLPELNQRYSSFIERHRPDYEASLKDRERPRGLPLDSSFVHRFWATYEFSTFPREDPNLPPPLQPQGWLGGEAADLLVRYRALLKAPAEKYIELSLGIDSPGDSAARLGDGQTEVPLPSKTTLAWAEAIRWREPVSGIQSRDRRRTVPDKP